MAQHVSEQYLQIFEGRKVRTVWDESAQEWYFSVADVVSVLTDSSDVKQYIKKMRTRDPELGSRWGTICTPTRMVASDGKYYNTQASTHKIVAHEIHEILKMASRSALAVGLAECTRPEAHTSYSDV